MTDETEFRLYLSHQSEHAVKNFAQQFEQKHNVKIAVNRVDKTDVFFKQQENAVIAVGEFILCQN